MMEAMQKKMPTQEYRSIPDHQRVAERLAAIQFAIEHRQKELATRASERDTLWKKLSWQTIEDRKMSVAVDRFSQQAKALQKRLEEVKGDAMLEAVVEGDLHQMREESKAYRVPDILALSPHAEVELTGIEREREPIVQIESYGRAKELGETEDIVELEPSKAEERASLESAKSVAEASLDQLPRTTPEEDDGSGEAVVVATKFRYANDRRDAADQGKLGEFGQDYMLADPVSGAAVLADGSASYADSYEVARLASKALMSILNGIPDTADQKFVDGYVRLRMPELTQAMDAIGNSRQGGAVFLAVRYLPLARALVRIQLGDCQGVIRSEGKQIQRLDEPLPDTDKATSMKKKVFAPSGGLTKRPGKPGVMNGKLVIEVIPLPPGEVTVTLASDGIQNNTGKHVAEVAAEIEAKGAQSSLEKMPNLKDDLTAITLKIPAQLRAAGQTTERAVA